MHGANRLASNSLLEGLVFAERVARDLANVEAARRESRGRRSGRCRRSPIAARRRWRRTRIRAVMWEHAGIARTARGLRDALDRLAEIGARLPAGATEELNIVQTAQLIVEAALLRKESRGGHYRADYPRAKRTWKGRHIEL